MATIVGVDITSSLRAGPSNPTGPESAAFFPAGLTERGPVDSVPRITSIAQYERVFGVRTAYAGAMYDAAQTFFEEGGSELYPVRVVGAAATKGTLTLMDRAGTPVATLKLDARDPGAWSTDLSVQVVDGGAANSVTLRVFVAGVLTETYSDQPDPASLAAAINGKSVYLKATNLGSGTASPGNRPAVLAATPLSAGADDRASVNATAVVAAFARIDRAAGPGAVAAPGYTATQVGAGLIAHAKANRRLAILAGGPDSDDAELVSMAAALTTDGEYGVLVGPYVVIPDGSGTRRISPESYVAGVRARAQSRTGFWAVPAGAISDARFVLGPVRSLTQAANSDLAAARVNGIRTVADRTRLYGWRSLSTNADLQLAIGRDSLNALEGLVEDALEEFVFQTIDSSGQLQANVHGALVGICQPVATAGGFFARKDASGKELDPGYKVLVDPVVDANVIRATVSVRLSPAAELIKVSVVKAAFTASV